LHNSLLHLLLENGDFLNTYISQGSVATRLGCGGVFVYDFVTNFVLSLTVKVFLTHCVISPTFAYSCIIRPQRRIACPVCKDVEGSCAVD